MTDSFWTGGPDAYGDGLRAEYEAARAQLEEQLKSCENLDEQSELEAELADMNAEYTRRRRRIGKMFY